MESSEGENEQDYIPLLPQEKGMDSFKYADDDDEETELTEKKTADGSVEEKGMDSFKYADDDDEETEMKSSEDENNDENSPLLPQQKAMAAKDGAPDLNEEETKMIENKSLDDGAEEIEKNSTDGSIQETTLSSEEMKEMKEILQKLEQRYSYCMDRYPRIERVKEDLLESSKDFEINVRKLLKRGFVPDNVRKNTLLHYAVVANSVDLVTLILTKRPQTLKTVGSYGLSPLHIAALMDSSDISKKLIKTNADLNAKDLFNRTPFITAAMYGSWEVVKILLQENAGINQTDVFRRVLDLAMKSKNTDVLKILLNCKDEAHYVEIKTILQKEDICGHTALHLAVDLEFLEGIKIMIGSLRCYSDYVSLLNIQNENGETVFHTAARKGFLECIKLLFKKDEELTTNRQTWWSFIKKQCSEGRTGLHYAVMDDRKETVKFLLQEYPACDMQDKYKRTPLSYAAEHGRLELTRILLDHSLHIWMKDEKGMAPIHYAAENGRSEVVKIFLEKDNFDIRSGDGRNCLDIAIDKNKVETVKEIINSKKWELLLRNKTKTETGDPQSPMRKLIVHMPDIAREVFDRCTRCKGKGYGFNVVFDYELLDDTLHLGSWDPLNQLSEGKPYTEDAALIKKNHPLMLMVTNERAELLEHPLVSALLKKKWNSIVLVFYLLNVMLYLLYLTMLTGFALDIKAPYQFTDISADENVCFEDHNISEFAAIAKYSVIVSAAIELFLEILELKVVFSMKVCLYLSKKENSLEWIACIFSILFVVNISGCTDTGYRPEWQWICGIISVFLVWINLLLLLQQFPLFGVYVDMLYQSIQVFMKFMPVFSLLIATFAVIFRCLFQNQDQFSTFWISFVKTTGMMIGELDFNKIFLEEEVHFGIISYVFFYVFMLVMAIVVVNLMVSLAVDMPKFQTNANLAKKTMQVKLALEFERLSMKCFSRLHADKKTTETLWSNEQTWLQKKIAESWKLTEKDITKALTSGTDGVSKEVTELKTEMRNMDLEWKNAVRNNNTDMQERMKSMESRLMSKLNKEEGMKAELQDKMKSIDSKLMTIIQSLNRPEDTASASFKQGD